MGVRDKNSLPELEKEFKKLENSIIKVGVIGNKELVMIASVNEFGARIKVTPRMRRFLAANGLRLKKTTNFIVIPERSFLRSTMDDKKSVKLSIDFGIDLFFKTKDAKKALNGIGAKLVSQVQKKIKSNIPPGNHPFTKEMKGGKNKTLINTGALIQGITYEVK